MDVELECRSAVGASIKTTMPTWITMFVANSLGIDGCWNSSCQGCISQKTLGVFCKSRVASIDQVKSTPCLSLSISIDLSIVLFIYLSIDLSLPPSFADHMVERVLNNLLSKAISLAAKETFTWQLLPNRLLHHIATSIQSWDEVVRPCACE